VALAAAGAGGAGLCPAEAGAGQRREGKHVMAKLDWSFATTSFS
jgi:hypothetical protein